MNKKESVIIYLVWIILLDYNNVKYVNFRL